MTDAGGVWRLDVAPGSVVVHIAAPGLPDEAVPGVPVVSGRTTELLVTLGAGPA